MAESFDPYYTWLGIPPHEQPPNHYRLLGLSPYESNAEVITNAADRLMLHLRAFQAGKRGKESQQLLNEVAAARVTLLDPAKKQAYDETLRSTAAALTAASPQAALPVARPVDVPVSDAIRIDVGPRARTPAVATGKSRPGQRPAKPLPWMLIIALVASCLFFVGGGLAFLVTRGLR